MRFISNWSQCQGEVNNLKVNLLAVYFDRGINSSVLHTVIMAEKRNFSPKSKKSAIWDFYEETDDSCKVHVKCVICLTIVTRGTKSSQLNTANMIFHIQRKHPTDFIEYTEKKKTNETESPKPSRIILTPKITRYS